MITPILIKESDVPIYLQIKNSLVVEMTTGRMVAESALPSVRKFAAHLMVSRTSIENAYNQLLAEGYIYSVPGRGYFVEAIDWMIAPTEPLEKTELAKDRKSYDYDFAGEYVAEEAFDFRLWKKHVNYVLNYNQDQLYAYGTLRGEMVLRKAICQHFYRSRGVVAVPEQMVVGSGVTPLLSMLARLFEAEGISEIAMEDPGFGKASGVFKSHGMKISTVEVNFDGSDLTSLENGTARACYVSPSHHFPTGYIMPVGDRQRILRWAHKSKGYVIEDDYNFELRFEGQPIPAMQGMDKQESVIYLGSFSTVLAPAIRISFMVLPRTLNRRFNAMDGMYPQTASKLEQLALARLIETGDFDKHIRRLRKLYTRKQKYIESKLSHYLPEEIKIRRIKAGLQMLIALPQSVTEAAMVEACDAMSVKVNGLSSYGISSQKEEKGHLVIGFRGIPGDDIDEGIRRIGDVAKKILNK